MMKDRRVSRQASPDGGTASHKRKTATRCSTRCLRQLYPASAKFDTPDKDDISPDATHLCVPVKSKGLLALISSRLGPPKAVWSSPDVRLLCIVERVPICGIVLSAPHRAELLPPDCRVQMHNSGRVQTVVNAGALGVQGTLPDEWCSAETMDTRALATVLIVVISRSYSEKSLESWVLQHESQPCAPIRQGLYTRLNNLE